MSEPKSYSEMTLAEKLEYERSHARQQTPYARRRAAAGPGKGNAGPSPSIVSVNCPECGRQHGVPTLNVLGVHMPRGSRWCDDCADKLRPQWERERAEKDAKETAERQAQAAERRRNWLYQSGVPAHYQCRGFEAFDRSAQPVTYDLCRQYISGLSIGTYRGYRSLVLTSPGAWGVGKTHLACAIGQELISKWPTEDWRMCPVIVTVESDIYLRIQASYNAPRYQDGPAPETEAGIINLLSRVPLLVIDDLGKQERRDMDFVRRTLFNIVNGRYNNKLPMIVTANKTETELRDYLGGDGNQATLDRLIQMCGGEIKVMTGQSWRRK